ncbi:MAG: ABC transporter ATP-binding protein [Deltaproteobacteria bacterium]|nr:ABC transporter ATP-binding protein [Deltaproteobacteria bacterium]
MRTVIDIRDLSFGAGSNRILDKVSLHVQEGEYLGIVGPNGAGKTTLLKCLMRIITGAKGSVEIFGHPIKTYSQRSLARLVSYVPQADGRALQYSVHEFVAMGRYPHLGPFSSMSDEDLRAIEEALNFVGISALSERKLETLSGGERQSVFIAGALAQGAKILLLDEPTTFLDPKHQAKIHALLTRLNRSLGLTVVAVTHDLNAAAMWMDRVIAIKNGKVAFTGIGRELMHGETLEKIFCTRFVFASHPVTGFPCVVPGGEPS